MVEKHQFTLNFEKLGPMPSKVKAVGQKKNLKLEKKDQNKGFST